MQQTRGKKARPVDRGGGFQSSISNRVRSQGPGVGSMGGSSTVGGLDRRKKFDRRWSLGGGSQSGGRRRQGLGRQVSGPNQPVIAGAVKGIPAKNSKDFLLIAPTKRGVRWALGGGAVNRVTPRG